jgi:hypothetical protein
VQCAGGSKGGIAKLFGRGNGKNDVVRRKSFGHGDEVDGDTGWQRLAAGRATIKAFAYLAVIAMFRQARI